MGVVPPEPGFLKRLRELTKVHGALLVFDEVITGFRIAFGGAQSVYAVTPDLTILGKVMGGGSRAPRSAGDETMEHLAPVGPVYQAGTLSGNPVAVAAGIAALNLAKELDPYPALAETASVLADGLTERLSRRGAVTVNRAGSMLSLFFAAGTVRDFAGAKAADHERYARLFHHLLDRGIWLPRVVTSCGPSGPSIASPRSIRPWTRSIRSKAEA